MSSNAASAQQAEQDPLVVFTPSGKRGRFALGTPILTAARQLGVDLDSVCGGRGICSKCQITPSYGEFSKFGVVSEPDALSAWNSVEQRYKDKRGLIDGRRLGCQATVQGDIVIDVPPESQVHKQVVRKAATARAIIMDPATRLYFVEVDQPDMHEPTGDLERLAALLLTQGAGAGRFLVPGAREPAGDLPVLVRGHIEARALAVYEAVETDAPAPDAFDAVLIHSARAGRALAALGPFAGQAAVALSPAAAEPLGDRSGLDIRLAARPDETALIESLGKPAHRV